MSIDTVYLCLLNSFIGVLPIKVQLFLNHYYPIRFKAPHRLMSLIDTHKSPVHSPALKLRTSKLEIAPAPFCAESQSFSNRCVFVLLTQVNCQFACLLCNLQVDHRRCQSRSAIDFRAKRNSSSKIHREHHVPTNPQTLHAEPAALLLDEQLENANRKHSHSG